MTDKDTEYYTVSQVAELTGVTAAQLKNWDKTGLLVAQRTGDGIANNRKLYVRDDIATVREILLYRSLGFGLEEIGQMLEAAPDERARLVAERTSKLKSEFSSIQRQIELSAALEVFTPETLLNELECDDATAASEEYDKDANLKMMVRWMRSHTQQDAERFQSELAEVLEDIADLEEDAPWEEVEAQLLRFCDVWSKPFGWPTVGQMLGFALIFEELADEPAIAEAELYELFDLDVCSRLSSIFYLAWADNALRVLDDILVSAYSVVLGGDLYEILPNLGSILCSFVCETGARPHLHKGEVPPSHPVELRELADDVFGLLEEIILDAEIGQYLDIDPLFTIEQQSMGFVHEYAVAFGEDRLNEWLRTGGFARFIEQWEQWYEALKECWRRTCSEEIESVRRDAKEEAEEFVKRLRQDAEHGEEADDDYLSHKIRDYQLSAESNAFNSWLDAHYARVHADPPRPHWITEEEAIAHERRMRALAQEAIAGQTLAGIESKIEALEADE